MIVKKAYKFKGELSISQLEGILIHDYKLIKKTSKELKLVKVIKNQSAKDIVQGSPYLSAFSPVYTFFVKIINPNEIEIKIETDVYLWLSIVVCGIFIFALPTIFFGYAFLFFCMAIVGITISYFLIQNTTLNIADELSKKIIYIK